MTRKISTAASCRIVTFVIAALVLAPAHPPAAFAASQDVGIWKVDLAKSKLTPGFVRLVIDRVREATPGEGKFVVVSQGKVYLLPGGSAQDSRTIRPVDYGRMTADGTAVLIGTQAYARDFCAFGCVGGRAQRRMFLSFKTVDGSMNETLAYAGQVR